MRYLSVDLNHRTDANPGATFERSLVLLISITYDTPMYGAFLRKIRLSRGLSQGELSDVVGIAVPNLSAYENDRQLPSIDVLNRIVVACGYQLAALAGDEVVKVPLAKGGWTPVESWPERHPDDPPESGAPLPFDAGIDDRLEAIERALGITEMLRPIT